jgi:hypothetical protein
LLLCKEYKPPEFSTRFDIPGHVGGQNRDVPAIRI